MSIYLRGNTYWYEFIYRGRRIQESAGTTSKTVAREAEKNRRKELERASVGLPSQQPAERIRSISALLKTYEAAYGVNHRTKSVLVVKNRGAHIERLAGSVLLADFNEQTAIEYM